MSAEEILFGEMPDPKMFTELELFCAGALSTLPPFSEHHPAYCLPLVQRVLEASGEWVPDDAGGIPDDHCSHPAGAVERDDDGSGQCHACGHWFPAQLGLQDGSAPK